MKKILGILVVCITSLFALGNVSAANMVAKVGDVEYATVQEAINNANNQTVVLLANVTESVVIDKGLKVTIDLNGFNLTNVDKNHTIINNGNAEIIGNGTVDNVSHAKAAVKNSVDGTLVLNGGIYTRSLENGINSENSGGNSYYTIENHGNMTINAPVKVVNKGSFSSMIHNGFYNGEKENPNNQYHPELTINGGVFDGGLNTVKNDDDGKLVIHNGTFTNNTQATVLNWNVTTITGGNFTSLGSGILNGKLDGGRDLGSLTVTGGNFTVAKEVVEVMNGSLAITKDEVKISGGTYNKEIDPAYLNLSENQEIVQNADGSFTIQTKKPSPTVKPEVTPQPDENVTENPSTYDGIVNIIVLALISLGTLAFATKKVFCK